MRTDHSSQTRDPGGRHGAGVLVSGPNGATSLPLPALGCPGPLGAEAVRILEWPNHFSERVEGWLLALGSGTPLPPHAVEALKERGLVGSDTRPTRCGQNLLDRLLIRERQAGDEQFRAFLEMAEVGPGI